MRDWAAELPAAIRAAVEAGGGEVIVATEAQAELGRRALGRMAPGMEGTVTFRVAGQRAADGQQSPQAAQPAVTVASPVR